MAHEITEVCNKLWLPLMINSEDISFHFKYQELLRGGATPYVDDGNGYLDHDKFVKWWFMPAEEFFHKYDAPPEEEPKQ